MLLSCMLYPGIFFLASMRNEPCGLLQVLEQRFARSEAERDTLRAALETMEDRGIQVAGQNHAPLQASLPSRNKLFQ